ncbi:TPA: hypothetical protein ACS3HB_004131 [Citrobacter freundii]
MKPTYEQLEQQVLDLAVQLANAESKCRELAADNERAMDSLKQADAAVKLAHEKFSALADENMALKSGHYNGMVLPETPVTDAFLAEVRAQGVEMAACALDDVNQFNYANMLDELAQKLRKGGAA